MAGLVAAAAIPVVLFWDLLGDVAATFEPSLTWLLTGASGFALMGAGLVIAIPVVLSIGRTPDHRLYPRSRGALAGVQGHVRCWPHRSTPYARRWSAPHASTLRYAAAG